MLDKVKRGELDHCINEIWQQIQRQQEAKAKWDEEGEDEAPCELPTNTPPEVVEFMHNFNQWKDPFDVPQSVWTVAAGGAVSLRPKNTALKKREAPASAASPLARPRVQPQERRSTSSTRSALLLLFLSCIRTAMKCFILAFFSFQKWRPKKEMGMPRQAEKRKP